MKLLRGVKNRTEFGTGMVATIGNFDGVHLGHQALLKQLRMQADALTMPVLLVLFEPQPCEYFQGDKAPKRLYSLREKLQILRQHDVDFVLCLTFNKTLSLMPAQHFATFLFEQLHVKFLLVGQDFKFGCNRRGDVGFLSSCAKQYGARVNTLTTFVIHEQRVSSTNIRQALKEGDLSRADHLLGRPYSVCGRVIRGDGRGRQWNIPTANINMRNRQNIPLKGVFCVHVRCNNRKHLLLRGVANLGVRPTVDGKRLILEVHLLNFTGSLYGEMLEVIFLHKLRSEVKFASIEALIAQIHQDIATARLYFNHR